MMKDNIIKYFHKDVTDHKINIFKFIGGEVAEELIFKPAHRRGDHYLFIFQNKGRSKLTVDFQDIILTGSMILCILPGQIHHAVSVENDTEAWVVTMDSNLIADEHSVIFNDYYFHYLPVALTEPANLRINECIALIAAIEKNRVELNYDLSVTDSLINAFVGMFRSAYHQIGDINPSSLRTASLTQDFKRLLQQQFKTLKSTSDYAALLNITPAYLNESVKLTTGFTVSFWIQQAIIIEAKRLLYDTDSTIKEIAYLLGYTDYAYFNRYFSNAVGQPPMKFRLNSRK